jgi:hypothetical protein
MWFTPECTPTVLHMYHTLHVMLPAQTVNAFPPSVALSAGHSDVVLINMD